MQKNNVGCTIGHNRNIKAKFDTLFLSLTKKPFYVILCGMIIEEWIDFRNLANNFDVMTLLTIYATAIGNFLHVFLLLPYYISIQYTRKYGTKSVAVACEIHVKFCTHVYI